VNARYAFILVMAAACDRGAGPAPGGEPSAPATAATASAAPRSPHAGRWSGAFVAEKAEVQVPEGVDYRAWEDDDGKKATGDGKLSIDVADDGSVSGKASGALGDLDVSGQVDDDEVRVMLVPRDPESDEAMSGTLVGEVRGNSIEGQLVASNSDATFARRAKTSLKRD
jgi:hypothetical protein